MKLCKGQSHTLVGASLSVPEYVVRGVGPVGEEEVSVFKPRVSEPPGLVHALVESDNRRHFVGPGKSHTTQR